MLLKNVYHEGKSCDILVKEDKIAQIADHIDASEESILECNGKAIFPSFANTHTHASMMFLRGIGEDKPLLKWLQEDIWPLEEKLTPEYMYVLSRFAILEMIRSGTTLFTDMYFEVPETIKAAKEMGIRAVIPFLGMDLFNEAETERRIHIGRDFLEKKEENTLITKALAGHAIYTTSEKLIRTFHELTLEKDTYFQIHSSETEQEVNDCIQKFGCRPVELLNKWGILGPKTLLAHAIHLTDSEIQLLKETKTVISHCPTSNLKLNSGVLNLQKYLDAGIRVTLGTDGASSNNSLSMISEMKVTALMAKMSSKSALAGKTGTIFNLATRDGFNAFNIDAGLIQEGKKADFILIDMNNNFMLPNVNLVSNLIYAADSSCITDVFCNGIQIMTNRHIKDEEQITQDFKLVYKELLGL